MWIYGKNSFLSIVEDKNDSDKLVVRGRFEGDIESIFPDADVIENAGTDYRYRTYLSKEIVSEVIKKQVEDIDYNNFKNSNTDNWRHDYLFNCWLSMKDIQDIKEKGEIAPW